MSKKAVKCLAFDLGASSGRAVLGEFDGIKIALGELHRFENIPVTQNGTLYWDFPCILAEIENGLAAARREGGFDTVGIDAWGVDFGLLGRDGRLIEKPVHYRDGRTAGIADEVCALIGRERLYSSTGIQIIDINTLFQMYSLASKRRKLLESASSALMIPELIGYFLTGEKSAEYSAASTTQMMAPLTMQWDNNLLADLSIPALFPAITQPGSPLGRLRGSYSADVISVAGHDTASAVAAVPARDRDFLYISCGTWSLIGTELGVPLTGEKPLLYNMTNEGGFGPSVRFLKNIAGLWLIQETRRHCASAGKNYGYAELERLASEAPAFSYFIDPDAPEFAAPGDIPARIRDYCARTGQGAPSSIGEIARCIYESLAMKYRHVYSALLECVNAEPGAYKKYRSIHMVGGGSRDELLCQMTASATGLEVISGPAEATALGNIAVQLISQGEIGGLWEAREIIRASFKPAEYHPENTEAWDEAYGFFLERTGL